MDSRLDTIADTLADDVNVGRDINGYNVAITGELRDTIDDIQKKYGNQVPVDMKIRELIQQQDNANVEFAADEMAQLVVPGAMNVMDQELTIASVLTLVLGLMYASSQKKSVKKTDDTFEFTADTEATPSKKAIKKTLKKILAKNNTEVLIQ